MKETLIGKSELNNSLFQWFNLSTQVVVALKCEIWKLKFMKMELEDKVNWNAFKEKFEMRISKCCKPNSHLKIQEVIPSKCN